MFKIFEDIEGKVNFVDHLNNLVGFDFQSSCCERFGWFISSIESNNIHTVDESTKMDLSNFVFDTSYFKELNLAESCYDDSGGLVVFKLTDGTTNVYLHLFNAHNGYYSHGWDAKIGGLQLSGSL